MKSVCLVIKGEKEAARMRRSLFCAIIAALQENLPSYE